MSNVIPVFPSSIFTWTDRVDGTSTEYALDVNSIASDLISVESTLGTNPEQENDPPIGNPIIYSTVSNRISDAMSNANLPHCLLSNSSVVINNNSPGQLNPYTISIDPYNMYNGTDVTIPANGWWIVSSAQTWPWNNGGYVRMFMSLNGSSNQVDESFVDWNFSGNQQGSIVSMTPPVPRWQKYGKRSRMTSVFFQGALHQGDRISVYSENGTSNNNTAISNMTLAVCMFKNIDSSFISG